MLDVSKQVDSAFFDVDILLCPVSGIFFAERLVTYSLYETVRLAIDDGDSAFVVAGGACMFVGMRKACDGLADARPAQGDQWDKLPRAR